MFTNYSYLSSIPIRLYSRYTKLYLSIVENWLFFIALLRNALASHFTAAFIFTHQHPVC